MHPVASCTVAAKRHLASARVLARSFREHHPDRPFFLLLADEVENCFDPDDEPFELIRLSDLADPRLAAMSFRYRQVEFAYACTAALISHLLARGHAAVAYFKLESLVRGDLSDILDRLPDHAITLTPHHLAPLTSQGGAEREAKTLSAGVWNVGFLGVGAKPEAGPFLEWWSERLLRHCRHEVSGGLHYEQRWLNLVPAYFEDVHVLRDPGFNLAHWNFADRDVHADAGALTADGRPARYVRFSGYDYDHPEWMTRYHDGPPPPEALRPVFADYHARLQAEDHEAAREWPYAFDTFDNGVPVPQVARRIHAEMGETADRFGQPFRTGRGSFFEWLSSPAPDQPEDQRPLGNLWVEVWRRRSDLTTAFPRPLGEDRNRFLNWIEAGKAGGDISPAFYAA